MILRILGADVGNELIKLDEGLSIGEANELNQLLRKLACLMMF